MACCWFQYKSGAFCGLSEPGLYRGGLIVAARIGAKVAAHAVSGQYRHPTICIFFLRSNVDRTVDDRHRFWLASGTRDHRSGFEQTILGKVVPLER